MNTTDLTIDTNKLNVRLGGKRSLLADGVQVRKWKFRSRTNSFTEESLEGNADDGDLGGRL